MWSIQAQHCGVHSGEGASIEKPQDDTPTGSAHIRTVALRSESEESKGNGAANS